MTPHPVALRDRPLPRVEGYEIFVGWPSHCNDRDRPVGMNSSKSLSLREAAPIYRGAGRADTTKGVSSPPARRASMRASPPSSMRHPPANRN